MPFFGSHCPQGAVSQSRRFLQIPSRFLCKNTMRPPRHLPSVMAPLRRQRGLFYYLWARGPGVDGELFTCTSLSQFRGKHFCELCPPELMMGKGCYSRSHIPPGRFLRAGLRHAAALAGSGSDRRSCPSVKAGLLQPSLVVQQILKSCPSSCISG